MSGPQKEKTLTLIPMFRDYLHYHIKCAKVYLHTRMRYRVATMLKTLRNSKPPSLGPKERKKWGGKTFKGH